MVPPLGIELFYSIPFLFLYSCAIGGSPRVLVNFCIQPTFLSKLSLLMEGLGNRLSALHFFMSSKVVLPMIFAALKLLQSSMVLTRKCSGMSSTNGV